MKKYVVLSFVLIIITTFAYSAQNNVGDKINDVLFTDIKTFINGKEVESFNINGNTAIYVNDLRLLGASVDWKPEHRHVQVSGYSNEIVIHQKNSYAMILMDIFNLYSDISLLDSLEEAISTHKSHAVLYSSYELSDLVEEKIELIDIQLKRTSGFCFTNIGSYDYVDYPYEKTYNVITKMRDVLNLLEEANLNIDNYQTFNKNYYIDDVEEKLMEAITLNHEIGMELLKMHHDVSMLILDTN